MYSGCGGPILADQNPNLFASPLLLPPVDNTDEYTVCVVFTCCFSPMRSHWCGEACTLHLPEVSRHYGVVVSALLLASAAPVWSKAGGEVGADAYSPPMWWPQRDIHTSRKLQGFSVSYDTLCSLQQSSPPHSLKHLTPEHVNTPLLSNLDAWGSCVEKPAHCTCQK